jgi:ABC-2 type transport system permease protein
VVAFLVSVALAVTVSFALRFMVNLTAFWLVDIRGVNTIAAALWTALSGFIMPIAFFPDRMRDLMRVLPFAAMLELPMNVFLERASLTETFAYQGFWVLVLLGAGRLVLRSATRRLVVQGG